MVEITRRNYRQDYYSDDFFILQSLVDIERKRLAKLKVKVTDHEISLGDLNEIPIFYLHLYFTPTPSRDLTYNELFGNL